MNSSADELRRVATAAAEQAGAAAATKAIHETFRLLGVDVADQKSVNEFRSDLVHARRLRRLSERVGATIIFAIATAIAVALGSWIWDGVKHSIRGD